MGSHTCTLLQRDVSTRTRIRTKRDVVTLPLVAANCHRIHQLESGVDIGVRHHPYQQAAIVVKVSQVLVVASPERQQQRPHGINRRVDSRKDNIIGRPAAPVRPPLQHPHARVAASWKIILVCVACNRPMPTGQILRSYSPPCVRIEILGIGQCVQCTTLRAELHHRRPVGVETSAIGADIHFVERIVKQPCQQQAVRANVGDDV